jgi:hypothetical protein
MLGHFMGAVAHSGGRDREFNVGFRYSLAAVTGAVPGPVTDNPSCCPCITASRLAFCYK